MEYVETLVIGAGQAGLASSYYLSQAGIEHVVLDRASKVANNWRNGTWDSFTLVTPKWTLRMPGYEVSESERHEFMPRNNIIGFFENYIAENKLPVKFDREAVSVEKTEGPGYITRTNAETYKSKNVVVATGMFQMPKLPKFSSEFSTDIIQIHSSRYRNPQTLSEGAVLVVGSGQSGAQIAEELHNSGRKVFLCVGTAGRAPRRYRGRDIVEWLEKLGFFEKTPEQLPPGTNKFGAVPHLSGTKGGHTINLHQLARDGVRLLGHLRSARNYTAFIAPDLHENLAKADGFERNVKNMIDEFIISNKLDIPQEDLPELRDGYAQPIVEELDLKSEGISTIIWAGGYKFDYNIIKLPVCDPDGFPVQQRGVTNYPGLYFVGMPWMPSQKSGVLIGVAEAAKYIVSKIAETK